MTGVMFVPTESCVVVEEIDRRYPPMFAPDYASLKANIAVCGIRTPLFVAAPTANVPFVKGVRPDQYAILDGRHRHRAARELTHPFVPVIVFDDEMAIRGAIDDNVFRRHMERAEVLKLRTEAERELDELKRRAANADADLLVDQVLHALRQCPESDRTGLVTRILQDNRAVLKAPEPMVRKALEERADDLVQRLVASEVSEASDQSAEEIAALKERLTAAQGLIKQYQGDLNKERERIVRLEKQVEAATNRKAKPEDSAQKAKAEQAIKALEKELEEAKAQAVDFSRKLKDAQTERGDLDADIAAKAKRLKALETQVSALQQRENYWREHWRKALTVAMDPEGITRDLTRMAELAQHVREVLHSSSDWAPDVRKLVLSGLDLVGRELADLRNLAEQIGVVDEKPTEPPRGPEAEEAA